MLDQKTREHTATAPSNTASRWLIGLVAVLVLAVAGLTAWAISERNEAEDLSADLTATETQVTDLEEALAAADAEFAALEAQIGVPPTEVVVGGGPLTARQEEMVAFVTGPWARAWNDADGDAVAALFTPDGVMYDIEGGRVLTVADGTIETFARSWAGLEHLSGMLVHDDTVVVVVELDGREVGAILDFTSNGELLVESNAMYDSILGPNG